MPGNSTEAREHVAKCMLIAKTATSPTIQRTFFDLANQWAKLANELDDALRLLDAVNELDRKGASDPTLADPAVVTWADKKKPREGVPIGAK